MATSRYGQGSIYRNQDGLYVGSVELPAGPDGHRQRRRMKARTKAELLTKMRDAARQRDEGTLVTGRPQTTGEWLDFWVTTILPGTVAASTERQYRETVRDWINPHIGKVPLAKLGPEHVVSMMRALEAKGLSPSTVRTARTILRRGLTIAERYRKVSRNAAALTDAPRHAESKLDDALDADQAAAVLQTASGDRLEALAVLVLAMGVRQGEALDLRWSDLDLDATTMRVIGTKTTASVRTVALPAFVVDALRRHRVRQLEERLAAPMWGDPDLVFTTTIGTRIHRRNALRWWHQLTIAAGVGRRRFHASRHTAATIMLNNGTPLEVVSATLGHAGLAITADVYAKVRPELQRTAADTMQRVLGTSP
jgi:integrase